MLPFICAIVQVGIFVHNFVSKFAKDLQPCKLDAIAATATFALCANLVQIYHFVLWIDRSNIRSIVIEGSHMSELQAINSRFLSIFIRIIFACSL